MRILADSLSRDGATPLLTKAQVESAMGEILLSGRRNGSARARSVNHAEDPALYALLRKSRRMCGVAVVCNIFLSSKRTGAL